MEFDPLAQGLKCPYCGYGQDVDTQSAPEVVERDFNAYLDRAEAQGTVIEGRSSETKCPGCGAIVLLEDKVATEQCPFCSTHLETKPEAAHAMIAPEGVMPFAVDHRGAREAFTKWLHGLWFAPTRLKLVAILGQFTGVYLPHWTYDTMTYTKYDGQRGDDYTETEWYTHTGADGKSERRSRTVTKTRWTWVSGEVDHFFDDVLVCASRSVPEGLVDDLGDWGLNELQGFTPGYLSGFKTERYAVGLRDGLVKAKDIMAPTIDALICRDIGGDHQRISSKSTHYSGITFKHLLLPVWVAVYRFHEQTFQVLVNGRSGKVSGYRPWSWWKIVALVVAILLAVVVVGLVLAGLSR